MNSYTPLNINGYEEVVRCDNPEVGFTAWIAIHNSHRGPALGGCRVWQYDTEENALTDVLRLSKGMTYKNSLFHLPLGGGKEHNNKNAMGLTALIDKTLTEIFTLSDDQLVPPNTIANSMAEELFTIDELIAV